MTYESLTQHYKTATNEYRAAYYWLRNHAEHEPKRTPHDKRAKLWHVDDIAAYKEQHNTANWRTLICEHLNEPMTVNELLDLFDKTGNFYDYKSVAQALKYWTDKSFLTRTGKGTKGSPYVYSIAVEAKDAA